MQQLSGVLEAARTATEICKVAGMQHVRDIALHLEAGISSYQSFELWKILSASYTPRLESLCVVSDSSWWVPEIPTLKHLRIEAKKHYMLPMVRDLGSHLEQLETLTLCSDIDVKHRGYLGTWDFDFAKIESLRCVNLQMVLPQGLKVPPGCQVHFVCKNISDASKVWERGLGAVCTSCQLVELVSFEESAEQPRLPDCLQRIV